MSKTLIRRTAALAGLVAAALPAFALAATPALAQDANALFAQGQRLLEEADALSARSEISQSNWTRGEARTALRAACELDHIEACKAYAQSMRAGAFLGDQRSMDERDWGYGRACDLGDVEGCLELGDARTPLGMFGAPRTPENWAAAEAAYRRACDEYRNAAGCERLAEMRSHGSNPNRDGSAMRAGAAAAPASPSPASAAAEAEAEARDHEARFGPTDGWVGVGPDLYRALAGILQRTGSMMRTDVLNQIERHVFSDGVLSEEERELLIELTAPRSSSVNVVLRDGQAPGLSIMPAFGQQRTALMTRLEDAAMVASVTWDEATLYRLFDATLRSPQMEAQARSVIAERVAGLAAASTVENAYGPLRGFIGESMDVVNTYEGEDNAAARGLLYDAIVEGVDGAPLTMPRFLYNWIRPGGHTGPERPRPQQERR